MYKFWTSGIGIDFRPHGLNQKWDKVAKFCHFNPSLEKIWTLWKATSIWQAKVFFQPYWARKKTTSLTKMWFTLCEYHVYQTIYLSFLQLSSTGTQMLMYQCFDIWLHYCIDDTWCTTVIGEKFLPMWNKCNLGYLWHFLVTLWRVQIFSNEMPKVPNFGVDKILKLNETLPIYYF